MLEWIVQLSFLSSLYWVDGGGNTPNSQPRIEMAAMDGSNRTTLVSNFLGQPRAIAVDHSLDGEGRVYWTDGFYRTIESVSLDGSDRTVVFSK